MRGPRWLQLTAAGLLALAVSAASGRAEAGNAPQPSSVPHCCVQLPPCAGAAPPDGNPPSAPAGLVGELRLDNSAPTALARLRWQPVVNATCIQVESLLPDPIGWFAGIVLPGSSTDIGLPAPQTEQSCFRIIAYNPVGWSPYSDETCVDVPGAPTFPAGWNLVSNTGSGNILVGTDGPVYCPHGHDDMPEVVPPGSAMVGPACWAFFDQPTTEFLATGQVTLYPHGSLPAGQWMLIGNPSALFPARAPAGTIVEIWDPSTNSYQRTTAMPPGQGAWAWAYSGAGSPSAAP